MKEGDQGLIVIVVLFWLVIALLVTFAIRNQVIENNQRGICQAAGYTWRATYANTAYCIRIDDGRLIGVPLEEVEAMK